MNPLKSFKEFIDNGIVKVQNPDLSRMNFLMKESEEDLDFLKDIINNVGITDKGANSIIKLCYDVLMGLIRAKMLLKGLNATGEGAHEAEVSYLRELKFNENDVQFTNQLRYYRNGIMYYGKRVDKEYAEKVWAFLNKIYPKLKKI